MNNGMFQNFRSAETRRVLRTMIGFMSPEEMVVLHRDRQLRNTDVPAWIEGVLREECTLVVNRLRIYEDKIVREYGHLSTMAEKLSIYHTIWENWDGLEPCPFTRMRTLRQYFDTNIPEQIKSAIRRSEQRRANRG